MQAMPHQSKMKMSASLLMQLSLFGGNVCTLKTLKSNMSAGEATRFKSSDARLDVRMIKPSAPVKKE